MPKLPKTASVLFFLQCLKKEARDEVNEWVINFLHVDKHESFLQTDTMNFDWDVQAFSKFLK